jgi:ABC-type lipoprotein release transport system permease subunit
MPLGSGAIAGTSYAIDTAFLADPASYLVVASLMLVAGAVATWIPMRRAMRVDPAVTLRAE